MKSRTTRRFRRSLEALPEPVRRQARVAYRTFCANPRHPSLQFKKVHASLAVYSVRVSSDYRALGVVEGDSVVWFFIGSHADYESLLRQL